MGGERQSIGEPVHDEVRDQPEAAPEQQPPRAAEGLAADREQRDQPCHQEGGSDVVGEEAGARKGRGRGHLPETVTTTLCRSKAGLRVAPHFTASRDRKQIVDAHGDVDRLDGA